MYINLSQDTHFKFCPRTVIINSTVCGKLTFTIVSYNDNIQVIPSSFKSFIKEVVKLNISVPYSYKNKTILTKNLITMIKYL